MRLQLNAMAEIIKIDFNSPGLALNRAIKSLNNNGVISFPTETFYGLGANALNEAAVNKVFRAKERDWNKPLLVFISSKNQLPDFTRNINSAAKKLIEHFWPGPLTLVFEASSLLPKTLTGNSGKIGIRVSGSGFVRQLCQKSGFPITGSSANISNMPAPVTAKDVMKNLGNRLDLILDGGKTPGFPSSTVLDVGGNSPALIRPGAIETNIIEKTLAMSIEQKRASINKH
jgi:L-threonylcarbamoyladenylate synthase